jgi:hypothetical protein
MRRFAAETEISGKTLAGLNFEKEKFAGGFETRLKFSVALPIKRSNLCASSLRGT